MKLSVTHYSETITIEKDSDDLDIYDLLDMVEHLMLAMGYHHKCVDGVLGRG